MGGSPEMEKYVNPTSGLLEGGGTVRDTIMSQLQNGLPDAVKAIMLQRGGSAIKANTQAGEETLKSGLNAAGTSGFSPGAYIAGVTRLRGQGGQGMANLYKDTALADFDARNQAFGKYATFTGLQQGAAGQANQFNVEKYKGEVESRKAKGEMWGSILGAGGTVLGNSKFITG